MVFNKQALLIFVMILLPLCTWSAFGDVAVPKLIPQDSAVLVMLAASLLVFRTFRERYLLLWIVGWLAYLMSRFTLRGAEPNLPSLDVAISHGEFVLAVCLFAAAVLVYTHSRKLLLPLAF